MSSLEFGADVTSPFLSRRVLVVGGGRWGRVHVDVLRRLLPKDSELLWVSRHNLAALEALISRWNEDGVAVRLFHDLAQALSFHPDAAIVATVHAKAVLDREVHVLVEKPLALREEDASDLVKMADQRGLIFNVGMHLFYASYLTHFRSLWQGRSPACGRLIWLDPETEVRYGEIKQSDFSTPKIHDAFPHVWSILRILFPKARPVVLSVAPEDHGTVALSLSVDGVPFSVKLDRRASKRSRRIELGFEDGGTADLDFTIAPGTPWLNGLICPADPEWGKGRSPLTLELATFLAMIDDSKDSRDCPNSARNAIGSVSGAVAASKQLRDKEAAALAFLLCRQRIRAPMLPSALSSWTILFRTCLI